MKKVRIVRASLGNIGYVINTPVALSLEPINLESNGRLTYFDENTEKKTVLYPNNSKRYTTEMNVYVDGFLEENNNISGQGGAEVEIVIKNQDGFDITNECVFEYSLEANYDIQFNYNGLYCVLILGGPLTSSYFNIINDDLIKTVNVNVNPTPLPPPGGAEPK